MKNHQYFMTFSSLLVLKESVLTSCETGLNPSGIVPVCPGSNPGFNCTTFSVFQEWNVTTFTSDGRAETRRFGVDEMSTYVDEPFNTPTHSFYVSSVRSSNPLVSQLYTRNVSVSFNGTIVECGISTRSLSISNKSVATIHVIRSEHASDSPVTVSTNESYGIDHVHVTLTLHWIQEDLVFYDVRAISHVNVDFTSLGADTFQALLLYNSVYNISITATLCGNSASTYIVLNFIKCGALTGVVGASVQVAFDDRQPALEGTTVSFSCPPGLVLAGPNTTTCMENGEWEPDPTNIKCKADCGVPIVDHNVEISYISTLEGAMLFFWRTNSTSATIATCSEDGTWRPSPTALGDEMCANVDVNTSLSSTIISVVSSLTSFVFGSLLFFTVGYLCAYCVHSARREKASSTGQLQDGAATTAHVQSTQDNVLYEDVRLPKQQEEEENLELKDNVAYGPLKTTQNC